MAEEIVLFHLTYGKSLSSFRIGQAGAARGEVIKMDPTHSVWLCSHYLSPLSKSFKLKACKIAVQGLQAKVLFIQFVSPRISFPVWKNKSQLNKEHSPLFLPFFSQSLWKSLSQVCIVPGQQRLVKGPETDGVFGVVPVLPANSPGGTSQRR